MLVTASVQAQWTPKAMARALQLSHVSLKDFVSSRSSSVPVTVTLKLLLAPWFDPFAAVECTTRQTRCPLGQ
jgi:hypothetical protein